MIVTTYQQWLNDGKPFRQCRPLLDLIITLRKYGYTGPSTGYPDLAHLTANPPEDHCPFSNTPWPGPQPYPYCNAIDLMPNSGLDVFKIGRRMVRDKMRDVLGTQPIKYINWTDLTGNTWHDSWMPNHTREPSSDTGHIHISTRTDYVTSGIMQLYNPLVDGDQMLIVRDTDSGSVYVSNGPQYFHVPNPDAYNALLRWYGKSGPDVQESGVDAMVTAGALGANAATPATTLTLPPLNLTGTLTAVTGK